MEKVTSVIFSGPANTVRSISQVWTISNVPRTFKTWNVRAHLPGQFPLRPAPAHNKQAQSSRVANDYLTFASLGCRLVQWFRRQTSLRHVFAYARLVGILNKCIVRCKLSLCITPRNTRPQGFITMCTKACYYSSQTFRVESTSSSCSCVVSGALVAETGLQRGGVERWDCLTGCRQKVNWEVARSLTAVGKATGALSLQISANNFYLKGRDGRDM